MDMKQRHQTERFWSYVDSSDGPDACWPWTRSAFKATGYGQATTIKGLPGQASTLSTVAHRQSWLLTHGDPGTYINPKTGKETTRRVLHKCPWGSNRLCCNPSHLAIGSDQENADDREREGRQARGEKVGSAKLTESQVLEIRSRHAAGESIGSLARAFDVDRATVRPCVRRETWTHL